MSLEYYFFGRRCTLVFNNDVILRATGHEVESCKGKQSQNKRSDIATFDE